MQLTQPELTMEVVCVCVCSWRVTCGYHACMASLGADVPHHVPCVRVRACIHKCIDAVLFWFCLCFVDLHR